MCCSLKEDDDDDGRESRAAVKLVQKCANKSKKSLSGIRACGSGECERVQFRFRSNNTLKKTKIENKKTVAGFVAYPLHGGLEVILVAADCERARNIVVVRRQSSSSSAESRVGFCHQQEKLSCPGRQHQGGETNMTDWWWSAFGKKES